MNNKTEKIDKLNNVLNQLKTEFVGLDDIIDEIGKNIFPWYITPELNNRPVLISLWGMSGVGKSSLVKRLLELLDLSSSTLTFDCGTEAGDNDKSISKKLYDYYLLDDIEVSSATSLERSDIFVFDEFQHARFLDEQGCELRNQALQPVFTLIDSGKLELQEPDWQNSSFVNFCGDLKVFVSESDSNAEIKLDQGVIKNPEEVKRYLEGVGMFYYDRGIPGVMPAHDWEPLDKGEEDPYRPLSVIENKILRHLYRKTKKVKNITCSELLSEINSIKTLGELSDYLENTKKYITGPQIIDCSKSLIFILGNLDEAFKVSADTSSDVDADIFYEETSRVTVADIKEALKSRFRPEQIARFGNNLIKYPTLRKKHFEEVIEKELNRICSEFKKNFNIGVTTTPTFKKLIYSESVFPTQGVRPVFSTINSLFNPLLSKVLVQADGLTGLSVQIDTPASSFKIPETKVIFNYSDGITKEETIKLTLGADRDPSKRKTRFINGIHEAGHAIVMAYKFGIIPLSIVAVSTDHGGFCITLDKDRIGEIDSREQIRGDVAVSLGGWCAERLIFNRDKWLLGSSSDIQSAWDQLSTAFYKEGYENFMSYSSPRAHDGEGIPRGLKDTQAQESIESLFRGVQAEVTMILNDNRRLLLETGKELGNVGEISGSRFMELIETFGGSLKPDHIKKMKEETSPDYYEKTIDTLLSEYKY